MLPKCLCGKEMEFVMNNRSHQLYKCESGKCARLMVRPMADPDQRTYYSVERNTWAEDKIDNLPAHNAT